MNFVTCSRSLPLCLVKERRAAVVGKREKMGTTGGKTTKTRGRRKTTTPTGRGKEGMGNRRMWATLGARETSANGQESKGNNNKERKVGKQGTCRQNS